MRKSCVWGGVLSDKLNFITRSLIDKENPLVHWWAYLPLSFMYLARCPMSWMSIQDVLSLTCDSRSTWCDEILKVVYKTFLGRFCLREIIIHLPALCISNFCFHLYRTTLSSPQHSFWNRSVLAPLQVASSYRGDCICWAWELEYDMSLPVISTNVQY